jgi:hypothetical protein
LAGGTGVIGAGVARCDRPLAQRYPRSIGSKGTWGKRLRGYLDDREETNTITIKKHRAGKIICRHLQRWQTTWLQSAENCGSTKWLKQFIRFYVAELQAERLGAEEFAAELEREFASRMLKTPAQQKNYRSNVVQAIKVFDPEHPAIDLVSLSTEQYRILNDQQRERIADRKTRFITSEAAEAIVERARA